jgi:ferredoxin
MRIVADTSRCVGAGQCVLTDPAVFDQSDDDGTVLLLTEHVDEAQLPAVREAVQICPSQALSLAPEAVDAK